MRLAHLRATLVLCVLLLLGCDHGSKHVAKSSLAGQPPRTLIARVLDLSYTENTDSGFGLLHRVPIAVRRPLLTATQLLAGVAFFIASLRKARNRGLRFALLLISAGAIGNGLDRLFRGYVVDFIHIHYWPVFNVADIYITVGTLLLVLVGWPRRIAGRDPSGSSV
jgi:signal peptidase II